MPKFTYTYPVVCLCLLSLSPLPALAAGPDHCTSRIAGWLHWDEQRHQAIICDSDQAYMLETISGKQGAAGQKMMLCRIPADSPTMHYRIMRTDYSQLPVYSSAAIHCLQQNIGLLLKQQQLLQQQLDRLR